MIFSSRTCTDPALPIDNNNNNTPSMWMRCSLVVSISINAYYGFDSIPASAEILVLNKYITQVIFSLTGNTVHVGNHPNHYIC